MSVGALRSVDESLFIYWCLAAVFSCRLKPCKYSAAGVWGSAWHSGIAKLAGPHWVRPGFNGNAHLAGNSSAGQQGQVTKSRLAWNKLLNVA